MRRPIAALNPNKQIQTTIPAPTAGLNVTNNLVDMPIGAAIALDNFIVKPYGCETRGGSKNHATGIVGTVESLLAYNATNSSQNHMFACAGNSIYDVTATMDLPPIVQTGLSSARWESTNFVTPGGHFLVAANGIDAAKLFDGTTWRNFAEVTTPTAIGEISGVNPNTFTSAIVHKLRIWFTVKDSTAAYYLPINSVGGTATMFDFGPYLPRGGYIVAMGTWSLDAGTGLDDLFVAVSSEGDVIIYKGTDPSDSSKWAMVGVWQLAPPVGKKCLTKFAGDLLLFNTDGLVALSQYLQSDRLDTRASIATKVQQLISDCQFNATQLSGWQTIQYSPENIIILNVPQLSPNLNIQLIYNTITDSWSTFSGLNAYCWAVQDEKAYFGTIGQVTQAFVGTLDNVSINNNGGTVFQATAQQAFNYFEKPGQKKQYKMARLTATSTGNPNINIGINIDFDFGVTARTITPTNTNIALWSSAVWGESLWGRSLRTIRTWQVLNGIGYAASLIVVFDATAKVTWHSTDWIVEVAGVL